MIFDMLKKLFPAPARRRRLRGAGEHLENRVLLASNVNFTGTSLVIGGGAENNDYTVVFNGTNYLITDTTGTGFNAPIGLVDLNAAANIVEFDPTTLVGFNRLQINGNGGTDSVDIQSFRGGQEGLTVGNTTESSTVSGSIGTAGSRVQETVILNSAAATFATGAAIFTNGDAATVAGALTLTGDATVDTNGTAAATFSNTVDGANSLTVNSSTAIFSGNVGAGTPLAGLSITAATQIRFDGTVAVSGGDIDLLTNLFTLNGASISGDGDLEITRSTAGAMTFTTATLDKIAAGFNEVRLGDALSTSFTIGPDGDNTLAGSADFASNTVITSSGNITITETLNQTGTLEFAFPGTLQFSGIGACVGTGDVTFTGTDAAVVITGNVGFGSGLTPWGAFDLTVNGPGTVQFTGGVGSSFASFTATATLLQLNHASALTSQGDVNITVTTLELNGGITSFNGSVTVNGNITATGNILLRGGVGDSVIVNGTVTGSGARRNVLVRGNNAALANVEFNGDVINVGNFFIDSSGVNTAAVVDLDGVDANSIIVRGLATELAGDLSALTGNIDIIGATTLAANIQLTSANLATKLTRFQGTVNGAFDLTINAGVGKASFTGIVGGVTPLNDLTVNSSGTNIITQNITVANNFYWDNGTGTLTLGVGKVIDAGNDLTILAGTFINKGSLVAGGTISTP